MALPCDRKTLIRISLISLFFFGEVVKVEPAVRIISPTKNQIIRYRNQSVLFNCTSNQTSSGGFQWLRNGNPIDANVTQMVHWSSFELKTFRSQDEGKYTCFNQGSASVKVYRASIPKVKRTGRVTPFDPNDYATVECKAEGWPKPTITWWRNNKSINEINQNHLYDVKPMVTGKDKVAISKLTIFSPRKKDAGIYTCNATNALKVVTKDMNVDLKEPENYKMTMKAEHSLYTVEVGKDASLACVGEQVKEEGLTWIDWEFNGTRLDTSTDHYNDSRIFSNPHDGTTPKVHMQLSIFNAHYADEGNYTCVVHSLRERVSDSMSLKVKAKVKAKADKGKGMDVRMIVVPVIAIVLLVLSLVLIRLKFRRIMRHRRISRLADKCAQCQSVDNDVFISYSSKDYEWLKKSLLPLFDNNSVKYIIHSRDFKPGKTFHDNMAESVYKSRNVVLVMSANYLSSGFCKDEMQMALYKSGECDGSLILLRIDKTKTKDMPESLRHKTFIDFTSREEEATWQSRILESVRCQPDPSPFSVTPNESDECTNDTACPCDTFQLIMKASRKNKKKRSRSPKELIYQA